VLIGVDLADSLGVSAGDKVLVYSPANLVSEDEMYFPEEVTVSGVYSMGQAEFDSGYIIASIGFARDLIGMVRGGAFSVHVKTAAPQDPAAFGRIRDEIFDRLNGGGVPTRFLVRTWQEVDRQLFAAIAVEKNMMVILLMFITVVAIFCVTNTLIVITVRKTSEIGLLKALGFSSRQVMACFVIYGWIQCIVGTVLGIGLAYLVLHNLQGLVDLLATCGIDVFPKNVYGLDRIPWRVIPSEVVQTALFVILFCTAASIVPAWRAASRSPVEALRS
jgi:lipoprotein-releasing system permease protein